MSLYTCAQYANILNNNLANTGLVLMAIILNVNVSA